MGLDRNRGQVIAGWIDTDTGEVSRARVVAAHRRPVVRLLSRFGGQELEVALAATTGWRLVVAEIRAVGGRADRAEPAETSARRGPKKRAKSGRADARHLRELLMISRLPESWVPADHRLDLRVTVRLRHTLSAQRGEWQQRVQAVLYPHGCRQRRDLMTGDGPAWLAAQPLPETAREQVSVALAIIDALDSQLSPIDQELRAYARRQVGCRALVAHDGIGALTAVTILAELGDCRRFSSSGEAVRSSGPDITVSQSDQRRAPGHLSRQGPPAPRWALFEAAQVARRTGSPDRDDDRQAADRLGANRACLAVARKLLKRNYHTLRELGEDGLQPASGPVRARPLTHTDAARPAPDMLLPSLHDVNGPQRPSGRTAPRRATTPSTIMSPDRSHPGPRTEIRRQWLLVGAGGGALSVSGPAAGPSAKRLMGAVRAGATGRDERAGAQPAAASPQQRQPGRRACRGVPHR